MKNTRWQAWETIGLLWTLAAGNLLHFVYQWTGESTVAGLFAAVNESTWEHMKLLAVPWVLFSLVEYIALRTDGVAAPRAAGLLAGLAAIPTLFTGLRLGFTKAWLSLVVVELVASSEGLGYLIVYGRQLFQLDLVMAAVVVVGAIGLLIDRGFDYAERRLNRGRAPVAGRLS